MRRIGHCGTLDPLASGVLITCLGRYTRLSQWISGADKEYESTFRLGAVSDTGDCEGTLTPRAGAPTPTRDDVESAMADFSGCISQVPPAYSAVKVGGIRSYELARRDEQVTLPPRSVCISVFEITAFDYPDLAVRAVCSKGTYVRALASDLGEKLGCGGYVERLRRVRVGTVDVGRALGLDEVERRVARGDVEQLFMPPRDALRPLPAVTLPAAPLSAFMHGNTVSVVAEGTQLETEKASLTQDEVECAVFDEAERLCGVGEWQSRGRSLRPLKVLAAR